MNDQCSACNAEIRTEDIVVCCELFCKPFQYFHARCVGLSYDDGCACLHDNIFWMCDSCRDLIQKGRVREMNEVKTNEFATKEEFNCLKSELDRISQLVSKIEHNTAVPCVSENPPDCLEPVSDISLLSSTKIKANNEQLSTSKEANLQLYVSNIANDVSEDEVIKMVCDSIGSKEVLGIRRLVASGTDISTLDYISYKVIIDPQFRCSAMQSDNWPGGIRCREFRNGHKMTWRPSYSQQTNE